MPNKAFNYNFKLLLEGIECPFKSVTIINTPNGVEANINLMSNRKVYDLKPKTSVQIFYRDWVPVGGKMGWRLLADGQVSSYFKNDQAEQGRGLGIVVRDFRMDIRKSPAALAYQGTNELSSKQYYHTAGLFHTWVVHGKTPGPPSRAKAENIKQLKKDISELQSRADSLSKSISENEGDLASSLRGDDLDDIKKQISEKRAALSNQGGSGGGRIKSYGGSSGLQPLGEIIARIAGTAYGKGFVNRRKGNGETELVYTSAFAGSLKADPRNGSADAGTFLDAVIRGMWTEAIGGTSIGAFQNRRTRLDKRFMIPSNDTGYKFWSRQTAGLQIGNVIMGNSRFSSLEAAIMRLAGLFSVRVYSCSTPTLISLDSDALKYVMSPDVKRFLVNTLEFGHPYILNETMLLPPLEFTAPPNCNIVLPPMCDRITWQYDMDADVTRGYFSQIDTLSAKGSNGTLSAKSVQVPNALFNIYSENKNNNDQPSNANNNKRDEFNRVKPPLTLEERYKGVSVYHGSVEVLLAQNDAAKSLIETTQSRAAAKKNMEKIKKLKEREQRLEKGIFFVKSNGTLSSLSENVENKIKEKQRKKQEERSKKFVKNTEAALNRHALLKYLNVKYSGRVLVVDMAFNPYIMCGFPGAVISDDEAYGGQSTKTIIGMVQQVKHVITITPNAGNATTTAVLNNARFEDEPTDIDRYGNPLYMKATDPGEAEVNKDSREFVKKYFIPKPKPLLGRDLSSDHYDLKESIDSEGYEFAKDIITLTENDRAAGESNNIYLDEEYEPNRIHKFYDVVFKHNSNHFMLGEESDQLGNKKLFAYDTMHEGFVRMRDRRDLLDDYESCIKYIARDVCSADAFYQGILGLSVMETNIDGDEIYVSKPGSYNDDVIKPVYFGVTTDRWEKSEKAKASAKNKNKRDILPDKITSAGQFSSIREHMPITAFIQERREAVEDYVKSITVQAQGVQFDSRN